jgi:choline dehydrogenase-like flavoprotein
MSTDHRVFPDDSLPEGSVVDGEAVTSPIDETFDFVVVGSGAAGGTAAWTLVQAGYSVAIVEEGPWVKTREFDRRIFPSFKRMFREAGTQALMGNSIIPLLQGRVVGGSTLMNSAIVWRTPDDVLDDWSKNWGLGGAIKEADLAPHFEAIEEELKVHAVLDEALGENNRLFVDNSFKGGFVGTRMRRYEHGCKGAGQCLTGCPNAAKQGMNVSYVPWSLQKGARIFTSVRVDRVEIKNGRAVGIVGSTTATNPKHAKKIPVIVRARRGVFVGASTIQTPNILRRSGIRNPHLGEHFMAHPGLGLPGIFGQKVDMHFGATQGAETIDFRKSERFKLETISMQPELAAVRIPGVGRELVSRLTTLPHAAIWVAQIRATAQGRIRQGFGGRDMVTYSMTKEDVGAARKAAALIARLFFESGAKEVWPGIHGLPEILRSMDEVKLIENAPLDSRAYSFIASHLFGAARMAASERDGVVGLDFSTHAAKGLYVVDSSIFPTNLGVNPQHSIMGLARLAATRVAADPLAIAAA